MTKTPDYTKRAVANYQKTKERVTILCDKGTKDTIKNKYGNIPISTYIKRLIDADLKTTAEDQPQPEPQPAPVQFENNPFE